MWSFLFFWNMGYRSIIFIWLESLLNLGSTCTLGKHKMLSIARYTCAIFLSFLAWHQFIAYFQHFSIFKNTTADEPWCLWQCYVIHKEAWKSLKQTYYLKICHVSFYWVKIVRRQFNWFFSKKFKKL